MEGGYNLRNIKHTKTLNGFTYTKNTLQNCKVFLCFYNKSFFLNISIDIAVTTIHITTNITNPYG